MTHEGRSFMKTYWREIAIILTAQLLLTFLGNFGAQKLYDYRLGAIETKLDDHIKEWNDDYKPKVDIVSWMHGVGIRGQDENNDHEHKN